MQIEAKHIYNLIYDQLTILGISAAEKSKIFDDVNKSTQNFRIIGSVKDGRKKVINAGAESERDTFITLCDGLDVLPQIALVKEKVDIEGAELTPEDVERVKSLVDVQIWCQNTHHTKGNKITFDRLKSAPCELCNREHDHAGMYICVFPDSIRQFCYQAKGEGDGPKPSKALWEAPKTKRAE